MKRFGGEHTPPHETKVTNDVMNNSPDRPASLNTNLITGHETSGELDRLVYIIQHVLVLVWSLVSGRTWSLVIFSHMNALQRYFRQSTFIGRSASVVSNMLHNHWLMHSCAANNIQSHSRRCTGPNLSLSTCCCSCLPDR